MTIDEAIEHCKEIARECELGEKPMVCAQEHWQLAEWLEELKTLKMQNMKTLDEIIRVMSNCYGEKSCYMCPHNDDLGCDINWSNEIIPDALYYLKEYKEMRDK